MTLIMIRVNPCNPWQKTKSMKVQKKYYDEIFDFNGQWALPSKCGLKIIPKESKTYVIVTELYQDNPGTSITSATASLAQQICVHFNINLLDLIYIECAPGMNSKLSFYDEVYYKVNFDIKNGKLEEPKWEKISAEELRMFFE